MEACTWNEQRGQTKTDNSYKKNVTNIPFHPKNYFLCFLKSYSNHLFCSITRYQPPSPVLCSLRPHLPKPSLTRTFSRSKTKPPATTSCRVCLFPQGPFCVRLWLASPQRRESESSKKKKSPVYPFRGTRCTHGIIRTNFAGLCHPNISKGEDCPYLVFCLPRHINFGRTERALADA